MTFSIYERRRGGRLLGYFHITIHNHPQPVNSQQCILHKACNFPRHHRLPSSPTIFPILFLPPSLSRPAYEQSSGGIHTALTNSRESKTKHSPTTIIIKLGRDIGGSCKTSHVAHPQPIIALFSFLESSITQGRSFV